jgi:type IV pilus assembly protein PilA
VQSRFARSYSAIEVTMTLGVIGILAAVAVPMYKDYSVRSRVSELIHAAAVCKTLVAEYYVIHGQFPKAARDAGCPERVTANANPLAVFNGEVIVQAVGSLATQLGPHNLFAFRAVCSAGSCKGHPIEEWVCSPAGDKRSSTTILPKYLPTVCR